MLNQIAQFILETAFGLLVFVLLGRFYMQLVRASFRNPVGQFLTALSDWVVLPARRVVPGLRGLDLATLVCAWLAEAVLLWLVLMLRGFTIDSGTDFLAIGGLALMELVRATIQITMAVVVVQVVVSWVSPYAPLAPLFNALARPLLRPFQRYIPLVGNVDLSPFVFLVLAQVLLIALAYLNRPLMALL
jgi:YggT family protein